MKRIIFDGAIFLSLFLLPWWITVLLALMGMFVFRHYYESLVILGVMYALHAIPSTTLLSSRFWFPVIVSVIFIGIEVARRYIILYKNEI